VIAGIFIDGKGPTKERKRQHDGEGNCEL